MTSTGSLPAGWRKVLAPDGRIYYQNDITKQTQWNEPTLNSSQNEPTSAPHAKAEQQTKDQTTIIYTVQAVVSPTKQTQPQQTQTMEITNQQKENMENNASIDDDDEYKSAGEKKIWHKDHIEWAFGVILTCYDYITDLSVVITWFSMNFTCKWPKYQCSLLSQEEDTDTLSAMLPILAIILLIGSSIGFLVRIVWLKHEGKELYLVYKYPINKSDADEKRLERYKRALYFTWMPLMLEDMLSVFLIWIVFNDGALYNVGKLGPVYAQSMVMSIISILKALILNLRKRCKLSKSAIHQETKKYRKAIVCHCCWCVCSLGIMFTVMLCVFMVAFRPLQPIYFVGNPNLLDLETEECHIFDDEYEDDYAQTEYLVEIPTRVSSSCYGIDVDWSVSCSVPKEDDVEMECNLVWSGDCVFLTSNGCKFTIDRGTCGKHIIECYEPMEYYYIGDSDWEEGDAVVFVCFDYCSL